MEISGKIIPTMCEPIAIFSLPPDLHEHYKELILHITASHNSLEDELVRSGQGVEKNLRFICNKKHQNIFRQFSQLESLEKNINSLIVNFAKQLGFSCEDVFQSNAWINHGSKGAALGMHIHRNSYFSGTYYVNYNPSIHSPIVFQNSRLVSQLTAPGMSLSRDTKINTPYNTKLLTLPYKEGDVLIWTSHVVHGYSSPSKGNDRITLSFNAMPTKCTEGEIYGFSASPY